MQDAATIEMIHRKYVAILADLDERASHRWAAAEAIALGYGGTTTVSLATGMSDCTIRNGIRELNSMSRLESDRQRGIGGGRTKRESVPYGVFYIERNEPMSQSELVATLQSLRLPQLTAGG